MLEKENLRLEKERLRFETEVWEQGPKPKTPGLGNTKKFRALGGSLSAKMVVRSLKK